MSESTISLRYGMNPHQTPAYVSSEKDGAPVQVLNGEPGYINFLDALNSWQLVRELHGVFELPAAASFKHVSPAGAALAVPLNDTLRRAYDVADLELSPLATAYVRARGTDRISSFGDWVALSDVVDVGTAQALKQEVSDGVIAPGYEAEALALLRGKKNGGYRILQIDPDYEPPEMEARQVFGVTLTQQRNQVVIDHGLLDRVVTQSQSLPEEAQRDLLIASITLKYTQSNAVCFAHGGQTIGVGAGQQSRIHCTRLAAAKAAMWYLRQHTNVLDLPFRKGLSRPERDNAIELYLMDELLPAQKAILEDAFTYPPPQFPPDIKARWLDTLDGIAMASDGFISFRDNIDEAAQGGVDYIIQPGGSTRDDEVIQACNEHGITMVFTGVRLFHH